MTREQRKDIFEAIGLIAIVASIVFLALEIRQNTIEVRLGNEQQALALGHDWDAWLLDAEFARIYDAGIADLSTLTSSEMRLFVTYLGEAFSIWEFAFRSHQSGTMSDETWVGWNMWFGSELRQESWQMIWKNSKAGVASQEFRSHVDSIVSAQQAEARTQSD
jgi:hypothetical protein